MPKNLDLNNTKKQDNKSNNYSSQLIMVSNKSTFKNTKKLWTNKVFMVFLLQDMKVRPKKGYLKFSVW